tara:strand:+ start:3222 stop:3662 length:441 start_codon:yes stop_codon:yes gene_type:complete
MPYQDWYTQATNAAVTMNMPPALVPPTQSFVAPPRQPLVPVNARPLNNTTAPVSQENRSTFAGSNLRSAGRFEKQSAMINPFATQSMILGGTDTGMITEAAENTKRKNVYTDKFEFRTQADMAADQYNSDIGMNNMNSLYEDTYLL